MGRQSAGCLRRGGNWRALSYNRGSIWLGAWLSGRASPSHGGGQWFESTSAHQPALPTSPVHRNALPHEDGRPVPEASIGTATGRGAGGGTPGQPRPASPRRALPHNHPALDAARSTFRGDAVPASRDRRRSSACRAQTRTRAGWQCKAEYLPMRAICQTTQYQFPVGFLISARRTVSIFA
jgi:hypothetical protein